jgi:hypothetical protein
LAVIVQGPPVRSRLEEWFGSLTEINAPLELALDAPAELEGSRGAELPLELLELPQREARTRPQWQRPPALPLMMWNAR